MDILTAQSLYEQYSEATIMRWDFGADINDDFT